MATDDDAELGKIHRKDRTVFSLIGYTCGYRKNRGTIHIRIFCLVGGSRMCIFFCKPMPGASPPTLSLGMFSFGGRLGCGIFVRRHGRRFPRGFLRTHAPGLSSRPDSAVTKGCILQINLLVHTAPVYRPVALFSPECYNPICSRHAGL